MPVKLLRIPVVYLLAYLSHGSELLSLLDIMYREHSVSDK